MADYVHYQYQFDHGATACDNVPNDPSLYTFRAAGDLDGDMMSSLFQLAVGSDANNELYHARGIFAQSELE